jgi:hypothetical protein
VEIKCQLDATDVFIADLIACSTCFRYYYAHHQELESIIQMVAACGIWFSSCRYGVELTVVHNTLELLMMGIIVPETS